MKYDEFTDFIPNPEDRWGEEKEWDNELWRTLRLTAIAITAFLGLILFVFWLLG